MKVLISAYSCEPGKGSEPGVGWNVAYEMAKHHDVWVLTRPDESGEIIDAELVRNPIPNLKFIYFTLPIWGSGWRGGSNGVMQVHYYLWQIQAYFVARRLHQEIGFDVMHHVTFVKYSTPSFLSFLPVPFIWGPIGGGESAPKAFWKDFSWRAMAYELARDATRWIGEHDPFVAKTARHSSTVFATTRDTVARLHEIGVSQVEVLPEAGLSDEEIRHLGQYKLPEGTVIRFISMGRLLHWKGFHLSVRAFAKAGLPNAEYWVVGDGPEHARLRRMIENLGVTDKVKLWGRLPRQKTLEKLGQSHVLVHPSLHDSGGWVCMEAMAAGRPIICLDLGGPAVQVTAETGFRVPAVHPEQAVDGIAKAIVNLAANPELRIRMGHAGQKRMYDNFSWKIKGQYLSDLYEKLGSEPCSLPVAGVL
ncbi:MAG: glycosyltransferase [Cyanothece sp. SIO1E1]|nr:glycosyltransferase [Cyanothece sp. SIO1E1]